MKKKQKIKIYLDTNKNRKTAFHNLWDTAKLVVKGKCIAIQAYLKKQEKKSQINTLTRHLMEWGKEQTKSKVNRRSEMIKIRAEINELNIRKGIEKISERAGSLKR